MNQPDPFEEFQRAMGVEPDPVNPIVKLCDPVRQLKAAVRKFIEIKEREVSK